MPCTTIASRCRRSWMRRSEVMSSRLANHGDADTRSSSVIKRVVLDDRPVFVKQYMLGDWGRNEKVVCRRAKREFELISNLRASALFEGRLGLVRVFSAEPQKASLVTEEVPGQPLEQTIIGHDWRVRRRTLGAILLAGRWLRRFQQLDLSDADQESISELDPHGLVDYCRVRLTNLAKLGYRWPGRTLCERILETVRRLDEQVDAADRRCVWVHGDFAPGNIIWDGRVLTPIDFAMACAERPLLDVTYFIHRLEMQRVYRPWKRWPIGAWKRAFLRGYGRPDAEASPMYQALMIRHLICRLLTYVRRPPRNWQQRLHDKYVRSVIRRRLQIACNCS